MKLSITPMTVIAQIIKAAARRGRSDGLVVIPHPMGPVLLQICLHCDTGNDLHEKARTEQQHRFIKQLTRQMKGFKPFRKKEVKMDDGSVEN
ncbi:MAG: hypothetical protein ABJZ79_16435 [Parasphingorhabdus sp.]|uniref:hypothetical protein n=1 Tax=Parasphingorhabdus sp. TaxID=2709688 RepID=UPI00329A79F8